MIHITHLDHLVLTVKDIKKTCDFYQQVLGMEVITFLNDRKALKFGNQKINLHLAGGEIQPHALSPTPGSADLCLISKTDLDQIVGFLKDQQITIEAGPVERTGAVGKLRSVYIRDPDQNLIEVSNDLTNQPLAPETVS